MKKANHSKECKKNARTLNIRANTSNQHTMKKKTTIKWNCIRFSLLFPYTRKYFIVSYKVHSRCVLYKRQTFNNRNSIRYGMKSSSMCFLKIELTLRFVYVFVRDVAIVVVIVARYFQYNQSLAVVYVVEILSVCFCPRVCVWSALKTNKTDRTRKTQNLIWIMFFMCIK